MCVMFPHAPTTATHYILHDYGIQQDGRYILHAEFFKLNAEGVWLKYQTDKYNLNPEWCKASRLYHNNDFVENVVPLLIELYPQGIE